MSDIEIMEFPYGAFLKVRLEFVLLRDNELEAKIMRIIEGWMIEQKKAWMNECSQAASDGKPTPPEPEYYVTLSYAQIIAQLYMFNSSRKGEGKEVAEGKRNSITRRTVGKAMQALIDDKVVFTRPNPKQTKEYDAAQYKLNCPLVQEQMRLLPRNPMSYLGSNGRIKGDPREIISHPPRENFAHGDVKNFRTLIDIENRDTNRMKESTNGTLNETTHSSTPSLSSVTLDNATPEQLYARLNQIEQQSPELEQLFTPTTELSPPVEKPLPIVSPTTENTEPRTVRKTDELQPALNLEEVRARGYWNRLGFIEKAASAKHWKTLAEHTKTFEQFESLFKYTRAQIEKDPRITKKEVNPGNMVREITGWKQEENRKLAQRVQPEQTRPMSLAERNREKMRMAGITTAAVTGRN